MTTLITKEGGKRELPFEPKRLTLYLKKRAGDTGLSEKQINDFIEKTIKEVNKKPSMDALDLVSYMVREADSMTQEIAPQWDALARNIYLYSIYKEASKNRFYDENERYGSYVGLQESLGSMGSYSGNILKKYSRKELAMASKYIVPDRDLLFNYNGLNMLVSRYLATDGKKGVFELPQERWLTIALYLMQDEPKEKRMYYVLEAYWALSNLLMTVATPTLANAGKDIAQLSSCFIDTVHDSLQGIYDSNTDVARVSKFGGGVGEYMGYVRATSSSIRGVEGAGGGVVPWIKQLNNTAVSVDQLGQRKGAIAVYLDVFHKDIESFLDLRLNNGDQRLRAHDIFTGICIPDLFMETIEQRGDWFLFDPHEVYTKKGWYLQDFYDEMKGSGSFREKYKELVNDPNISKKTVNSINLLRSILKSQIETGTPYMFYRDNANRANPNKHAGMIYCSNLCTEIMQNQSPTIVTEEYAEDGNIYIKKKAGDFVVCNLSSVNLSKAIVRFENKDEDKGDFDNILERLINIQVRMLDNVISVNKLPVPQATITNQKYRAIGLGTFGWHHLLALKGIHWNSEEAVEYCDEVYEQINYLAIKASNELAKEKGAYPLFEGSEWHNGGYFEFRDYVSENWNELKDSVAEHGLRNAYIMAIAPNMSIADIANSTPSIDPVFKPFYYVEKKDFTRPVIAPDYNFDTMDYYGKGAYAMDQFYSVKQNVKRQRHVDQASSFNLYAPTKIAGSTLRQLHFESWNGGVKSTYYLRTTNIEVEECEWCAG